MTEVILFLVSIFVMLMFLAFRSIEVKRNKNFISLNIRNKSDRFILKYWRYLIAILNYIAEVIAFNLKKIPTIFMHIVSDIWEFITERSSKYVDVVRGKGTLKKGGSVSFFISSISEGKEKE